MSDAVTLHSMPPVWDVDSHILILGSMPGMASLSAQAYYAHPRNAFWRILYTLFETDPPPEDIHPNHAAFLHAHHIALWDVAAACRRVGSSDASITDVLPNDIPDLICRMPKLHAIACNGNTAARLFAQFFPPSRLPDHLAVLRLPSTSPAYASMSFAQKLEAWRDILRFTAR